MPKTVQVPISFLEGTRCLLDALNGYNLDNDTKMLCNALEGVLVEKEAAIKKREKFSEYKNATTGTDQREARRNEYLNYSGVHKDWRTNKEITMREN